MELQRIVRILQNRHPNTSRKRQFYFFLCKDERHYSLFTEHQGWELNLLSIFKIITVQSTFRIR